jgi:hypothetical protein
MLDGLSILITCSLLVYILYRAHKISNEKK